MKAANAKSAKEILKMKIFKRLRSAAACAAAALMLSGFASAERIDWYFTPSKDGSRPVVVGGKYGDLLEKSNAIYLAPEGEKRIYLTFDAGYDNGNVGKIIDALVKHDAPATFFILPGIIRNSPETVRKMIDNGFTIGNHSTHHGDMSRYADAESFKAELEGVEKLFYEFSGTEMSKFFRPPEGAFSPRMLELCAETGYIPVFWSHAYADWDNSAQPDPERSLQRLTSSLHDGMVLLLHPTSATNAAILDGFLTKAEEMGYSFGSLDELIP